MAQEVCRRRGRGKWRLGRPVGMKTDENVEKVRTLCENRSSLGIIITAEELNMDKETMKQIVATNLNINMKKRSYFLHQQVCDFGSPAFSQKTNINSRTLSVFIRSCPP
jgi:hypothetical protein